MSALPASLANDNGPLLTPFKRLPDLPAIDTLKQFDQWLVRRGELPTSPKTGEAKDWNNPANWGSHDETVAYAERHGIRRYGIVLGPDDGLTGIDLDDCRDAETGVFSALAKEVIALGETYIEISRSGKGLHLFAFGKIDKKEVYHPEDIEMYPGNRFLEVTGDHLPGSPTEIRPAPKTVALLYKAIAAARKLVADKAAKINAQADKVASSSTSPFWRQVNDMALAKMDAWVPALFGAAASKLASGVYRVKSDDLSRDLEEDLSFSPKGIKDFGLHDQYGEEHEGGRTALDIVVEYGPAREVTGPAIDLAGAAKWLCDRMGVTRESLGWTDPSATVPQKPLQAEPVTLGDLAHIPPRPWVYGFKLQRGYVTFLGAPGGAGKTAWIIAAATAMASGRTLLHDAPHGPLRVWVFNLEDDRTEMKRRLAAAVRAFDVDQACLGNLRLNSGRDRRFRLVELGPGGSVVVTPDKTAVVDEMRRERIDVLVIDPYLRSHGLPENDNAAQDEVMRLYAEIAEEAQVAILLVHHTKKGAVGGELDGLRGGSTQGGGARAVFTMTAMSAAVAKEFSIEEADRRRYVLLEDAKGNMSPPAAGEWIHLHSVSLSNGTPDYPSGDNVQVAVRWNPPSVSAALAQADGGADAAEARILAAIEAGHPDGEKYSIRPQDTAIWAGHVVAEVLGCSAAQAKELLTGLRARGLIGVTGYRSPTTRKMRNGLIVLKPSEPDDLFA